MQPGDNWNASSSMAAAPSWTAQQVLALIEVYKNHRLLYELKNPLYHHKTARRDALEAITECVKGVRPNTTPEEVKVKLNSLRTQFNRQIATIKNKRRAGNTSYKGNLWCFEQLKFLEDFVVARRARTQPAAPPPPPSQEPSAHQQSKVAESCVKTEPPNAEGDDPCDDVVEEENLIEAETSGGEDAGKRKLDDGGAGEGPRQIDQGAVDRSRSYGAVDATEWDNFGEFVSLEMQKLLSAKRRRLCKREVITVLMKYQEEEDHQFVY